MIQPLLDTHVWIWWMLRTDDLEPMVLKRLDDLARGSRPLLSAMSLWEMAMLVERGRVVLKGDLRRWLRVAAGPETVEVVPITPDIAAASASLPSSFHRDPADRLLVATAKVRGCPVLTHDERILASGLVRAWIR